MLNDNVFLIFFLKKKKSFISLLKETKLEITSALPLCLNNPEAGIMQICDISKD